VPAREKQSTVTPRMAAEFLPLRLFAPPFVCPALPCPALSPLSLQPPVSCWPQVGWSGYRREKLSHTNRMDHSGAVDADHGDTLVCDGLWWPVMERRPAQLLTSESESHCHSVSERLRTAVSACRCSRRPNAAQCGPWMSHDQTESAETAASRTAVVSCISVDS
jgi:hypothetical protein